MSKAVLVYGKLKEEGLEVAKVSISEEKRKELEEEGINIPSNNGSPFEIKGDYNFVERMAREIKKEGVIIRYGNSSYSGIGMKTQFLDGKGSMTILEEKEILN